MGLKLCNRMKWEREEQNTVPFEEGQEQDQQEVASVHIGDLD